MPGGGPSSGISASLTKGIFDERLLDFEVLSVKALLAGFRTCGPWPENMPPSDWWADLGLPATGSTEPAGNSGGELAAVAREFPVRAVGAPRMS